MTLIDKAEALRRIVLTGEQMAGASSSDVVDAIHRDVAALSPAPVEAQARPEWLSNCVICGRIVDTREAEEGGDGHGCEYAEGWICSSDCAEKLHPGPDWMKEGLATGPVDAQAREAALSEASGKLHDLMCLPEGADLAIAKRWASEARALIGEHK